MTNSSIVTNATDGKEDWRSTVLRRELLRHARSLEQLAAKLEEAEAYPTDTAVILCQLIRRTSGLVASNLHSAPIQKLPFINTILRTMGENLRFAERSRIEQTPWSMVQATEAFLTRHTPKECCFILRPQWSYNYSIRGLFVESLRSYFDSLSDWMPISEWEHAVGEIRKRRVYCISFPRVERMNVLMHVNWGHEVGHILASDWLQTNFADLWVKEQDAIKKSIMTNYDTENSSPELLKTIYRDQYVSEAMKETMELTQSGLRELISDFVGAYLLGPAALAGLGEYSVRYELDVNPRWCGRYPPWRMRIRKISEVVANDLIEDNLFDVRSYVQPYLTFLRWLRGLASSNDDIFQIDADVRTREAYHLIQEHWPTVITGVLKLLPRESQGPYQLKRNWVIVNELVQRLNQGIPPNETGAWPNTTPATLADIWNAAWAYSRLRLSEEPNWGTPNNFEDLFRLVLKAIEASYVQTTFGPKLKLTAENEHTKQRTD